MEKAKHGGRRKGAGRKPKHADARSKTYYMPGVVCDAIDAEAERLGIPSSALVERMWEEYNTKGEAT